MIDGSCTVIFNNPYVSNVYGGDMKTLDNYKGYLCGKYRKKTTRDNYLNCVKRFIRHTHGVLSHETIQGWKIWANNYYRRSSAINSNINAINVFLRWYIHNDDEYNYLKIRLMPRENTKGYSLSEQEYFKVMEKSRNDPETALIFGLLSHLIRPSEIINIKIKDKEKNILYLYDTKTGDREVPLAPYLQTLWDDYLKIRPKPRVEYREYLLISNDCNYRGYKYRTTLPMRNRILNLGLQAGIIRKVKPYTIKRTCITLMLDKNSKLYTGNPVIPQLMAGHSNIETTMKYNITDNSHVFRYLSSIDKLYTLHIVNHFPQDKTEETNEDTNNWCYSFNIFSFDLINQTTSYMEDCLGWGNMLSSYPARI